MLYLVKACKCKIDAVLVPVYVLSYSVIHNGIDCSDWVKTCKSDDKENIIFKLYLIFFAMRKTICRFCALWILQPNWDILYIHNPKGVQATMRSFTIQLTWLSYCSTLDLKHKMLPFEFLHLKSRQFSLKFICNLMLHFLYIQLTYLFTYLYLITHWIQYMCKYYINNYKKHLIGH